MSNIIFICVLGYMSDLICEPILISVIIPSYNRSDTVGETIESIVTQQVNARIEVVIGDDCSTDDARKVLLTYKEKYPDLIRLIFHEHNIGLGANWATCVKACNGKYICNCDNDDYWHNPKKLQLQLDYMEANLSSNVLFTDYRHKNRDTGNIVEISSFISRDRPLQDVVWGDSKSSYSNATVMYRADFLKSHLNLDEWIEWKFSLQDWPAWVILAAYTDFDILHVSTATMCIENTSITRPQSVEKLALRYEKDKKVCEYLSLLFPNKFPFDEDDFNRYAYGRCLLKAYHLGDYKNAKKYAKLNPTGVSGLRVVCAKCWLLFQSACLLRNVKEKLKMVRR